METNVSRSVERDRTMWFSMWFLASIISFGLAFFPMFYYSVERRNRHFRRQAEWEKKLAAFFNAKETVEQTREKPVIERSAPIWAASIITIVPVFVIAYFLCEDLVLHERHQQEYLRKTFPEASFSPQNIQTRKYVLITLVTLGVGVVFWLYKILNIYNRHFIEQRSLEIEIDRLVEEKSHGEPV